MGYEDFCPRPQRWLAFGLLFHQSKFYQKNKQIYYSFNLKKLKDIKYKGSSKKGDLQLIAIDDDIIVQTHNSRKGDVDEMANLLSIPLKNMEPEKMDSLMQGLNYLKDK